MFKKSIQYVINPAYMRFILSERLTKTSLFSVLSFGINLDKYILCVKDPTKDRMIPKLKARVKFRL